MRRALKTLNQVRMVLGFLIMGAFGANAMFFAGMMVGGSGNWKAIGVSGIFILWVAFSLGKMYEKYGATH